MVDDLLSNGSKNYNQKTIVLEETRVTDVATRDSSSLKRAYLERSGVICEMM